MGTGLRPQRLPSEWEKRPLELTKESPQGPEKQGAVTSRSMQAPIPSTVVDAMASAPGGFVTQILAGRPGMQVERARPGDGGNVVPSIGGLPAAGSGPGGGLVSKPGIQGGTAHNAHFGAGKGGF